jgi:chaperonin GroEL
MGKTVVIGQEARDKTLAGVDTLANAVKATLGPRGRNVAIEIVEYSVPLITKDGVTVARHITLDDRLENMGAQLVKSVAAAANSTAGDGTTTATVLAQAIYGRGLKMIAAGYNPVLVKRGIDIAVTAIVAKLKKMSMTVSDEETLAFVATISANNDKVLGKMIAEAISMIGDEGVLTVESEAGSETRVEYTDGFRMNRGILHPSFITNPSKLTAELNDTLILLYDNKISNIKEILTILQVASENERAILVIAKEFDPEVISQIAHNCERGSIKACALKAAGFGDHRRAILDDLAVVTGGVVLTSKIKLEEANLTDLGTARKVVVGLNSTSVIDGAASEADIEAAITIIRDQLAQGDLYEHQTDVLKGRLTRLGGGAAIFKVGGTSESEVREKRDRVEDAINAVRSALEEGIVPGGGSALIKCIPMLDAIDTSDMIQEEKVGIEIVRYAITTPFSQIMANAGSDSAAVFIDKIAASPTSGYDALRMEYVENMLEKGIVDPVKVVRSSLEHAASASGILLTTEVAIYNSDK